MTIPIQTCTFVLASDLFKRLGKLWDEFVESSPNFSWGNNSRSFVVAADILNHLDNSAVANERQLRALRSRVDKLPDCGQTYVDLEN